MARRSINMLRFIVSSISGAMILSVCVTLAAVGLAQSGRVKGDAPAATSEEPKSAQALYEEADSYIEKKYEEFNQKKLPFDPKLEEATRQEQKDLAAKNAGQLLAREKLSGSDFYYLGMLYHLAVKSEPAIAAMKRFLSNNPAGRQAQDARAVIVVRSLDFNLIGDAENTLAEFAGAEPRLEEQRYELEKLVTDALYKQKQFERMIPHATEMLNAAKLVLASKVQADKRDEMLYKSALFLSEAYLKAGKKAAAIAALDEVRKLAVSFPSGGLYRGVTMRLRDIDPLADRLRIFNDGDLSAPVPPEIVATQWIDHEPTTLAALRGQVVLLDFWATWCGPCRITFPRLKTWQNQYQKKGLVILGMTNFFGNIEGHPVSQPEEIAFLREFKKRNGLRYPFAIADSSKNDRNYGVVSIPMSFLLDREGRLRYIALGANEDEIDNLGKMIKKVVEEPVKGTEGSTAGRGDAEQSH